MDILKRKLIQKFHRMVNEHTSEVLNKFGKVGRLDLEEHSHEEQITILVEEVGKLSRASNKMRIAADKDVYFTWEGEFHHRLLTIGSIVSRLAAIKDFHPEHGNIRH